MRPRPGSGSQTRRMLRSGSMRVTAAQMPPPALGVRVVRGARVAGRGEQGGFPADSPRPAAAGVAVEPPERAGAENHRAYGRPGQHPCDGFFSWLMYRLGRAALRWRGVPGLPAGALRGS